MSAIIGPPTVCQRPGHIAGLHPQVGIGSTGADELLVPSGRQLWEDRIGSFFVGCPE